MRIAVFCGSSSRVPERFHADARVVGEAIAKRGHVLVYGGGRTGLMGSVADAALAAGGVVHGVILREFIDQDVHHTGIAELQEGGFVPMTPVAGIPRVPAIGLYPTVETLTAQGALVALALVALVWTFVIEPRRALAARRRSGEAVA